MQKTADGDGFLLLITSPIDEIPASLVISFVVLTFFMSTVVTALCLHQPAPPNPLKVPPTPLSN